MVVVSGAAGIATLALVGTDRFGLARASAAVAVAAIVAGWAFAQEPVFLPGLTIEQAAAGHSTLVAVVVTAAAGAVVLVPSLFLLFRLFLLGRLETGGPARPAATGPKISERGRRHGLETFAAVTVIAGVGITAFADPGWARAVGVLCLFAAAISTFRLLTAEPDEGRSNHAAHGRTSGGGEI